MNTEDTSHTRSELYAKIQRSKDMRTICGLFDLTDYYDTVTAKHAAVEKRDRQEDDLEKPSEKKQKV
jgi:hypothetical protein